MPHEKAPTVNAPEVIARLFEDNKDWGLRCAGAYRRRLPRQVALEELESAALEGLWQAAQRFDAGRHLRFRTLAGARILGAMRDWMRKQQWFGERRGDRPAPGQLPVVAYKDGAAWEEGPRRAGRSSRRNGGGRRDVPDHRTEADEQARALSDLFARVARVCTAREHLLLVRYYRDCRPMARIAAELGLSESRVSQLHSDLCARLKRDLDRNEDFARGR